MNAYRLMSSASCFPKLTTLLQLSMLSSCCRRTMYGTCGGEKVTRTQMLNVIIG